jgi:hypothetical protein
MLVRTATGLAARWPLKIVIDIVPMMQASGRGDHWSSLLIWSGTVTVGALTILLGYLPHHVHHQPGPNGRHLRYRRKRQIDRRRPHPRVSAKRPHWPPHDAIIRMPQGYNGFGA